MVSCPHVHGMVPVNAGDILHIFAYLPVEERPLFYRLENWPQLFFRCSVCVNVGVPFQYDALTWQQALEWAEMVHSG